MTTAPPAFPRRGRFGSVVDGSARLGLEHADEVPGEEFLVLREVELVRPRYTGGDTAEGRDQGANHHGVRDSPLTDVLGGEPHESFREASSSVNLLGGERCGMRRRASVHDE